MYTIIRIKRQNIDLKHPQFKNGRDGTKRSIQPCFHNGPPRGVYERKVFTKEQKKMFIAEKLTVMFKYLNLNLNLSFMGSQFKNWL